jgi:hypothetical protein
MKNRINLRICGLSSTIRIRFSTVRRFRTARRTRIRHDVFSFAGIEYLVYLRERKKLVTTSASKYYWFFPLRLLGAIPSVLQSIIVATNIDSRQYEWRETSIPLPEDLVRTLAEHARVAIREIQDMVAKCIWCKQGATVSVVGTNENIWQGKLKSGKLPVVLYGLCKPCSDQPKAVEKANAAA